MLAFLLSIVETDAERELVVKLFETYRQRMYYLAYDILKNKHDAEDAVSSALIRIINNLKKIADLESVKTRGFIYIITKNAAIDIYNARKKHIHTDIDELNIPITNILEDDVINKIDYQLLNEAINRLNEDYQHVLILRYYYGLKLNDIALSLGITINAAKNKLYRAQSQLMKELGDKFNE